MAVQDYGLARSGRWCIHKGSAKLWSLFRPGTYMPADLYATFAEAHTAYLDAVTCKAQTPFLAYTEPRCTRSRGHEGACLFPSLTEGEMPLRVNPR